MTKTNIFAAGLITLMVLTGFLSFYGDSLTFDESPHVSAGYSYLTQRDMRLNPEHPPLVKDLAALPLLFQNLNFPQDHPSWREDVNGQWTFGSVFFFEAGNNPDSIMLASRSAMLILLVLLALYIFKWAKERYGDKSALFALFLFSFSPAFLAHGRLVTTDVGATFGFVIALYYFLKFLTQPSRLHLILAGLAFGLAQLLKFSLFLLVPFYIGVLLIFWLVKLFLDWPKTKPKLRFKRFGVRFFKYFRALLAIFVIGYLLIWPVYQFHVWDYPVERQVRDTEVILASSPFRTAANATIWMASKPILRPYAQYFLGLLMIFQRTGGGNTTYFLGDVSSTAWKHYFPIVFALKVPVALLAFIIIAFGAAIGSVFRQRFGWRAILNWLEKHFVELTWVLFVVFYWLLSIFGNLNLGVRHVLPTLPFIYLLVVWQLKGWIGIKVITRRTSRILITSALVLWYFFVSVFTFPFYLAYFNEIAGGPANGHKFVVDSNLDWGQDLKRLANFVEERGIERIKVDYFGGDSPAFRLGNKYERLDSSVPNQKGWLAISATLLQNGRGRATKGFDQPTTNYLWLNDHKPVARAGFSIFIYNIE